MLLPFWAELSTRVDGLFLSYMSLLVFESFSAVKMSKCFYRHRGVISVRVPLSSDPVRSVISLSSQSLPF